MNRKLYVEWKTQSCKVVLRIPVLEYLLIIDLYDISDVYSIFIYRRDGIPRLYLLPSTISKER